MLRPTDSYRSSPTTPLDGFGAPPEMCYVELKKVYAENWKKNLLVILLGPPHNPPQKWTAQKFDLTNYLANSYEKNIMVNFFG